MGDFFKKALTYGFLGLAGVLIIMNAKDFATAVQPVSSFIQGESKLLTGSGYQRAK